MENEVLEKFNTFLANWSGTSMEEQKRIVDQTIQKKDPVLNFAVETCRLIDDINRLDQLSGERLSRCTFLAVATASRLMIHGSLIAFLHAKGPQAGELKVRSHKVVPWTKLVTALQAMSDEQFQAEYYQWALRAVQKKQNPLPASALNDAVKFIKFAAASSRPA